MVANREMDSGGSLEVKNVFISIDPKNSWQYTSVPKSVVD
jgi:hypothetical protein